MRRLATIKEGLDRGNQSCYSASGGKHNRCVISQDHATATLGIAAESLERRQQYRFIRTNVASDLIVNVGELSFHLHKLPMVSRSGYLNKLVFQRSNNGDTNSPLNIHLHNVPGGSQVFELVVKFCYGLPVELTPTNVAPLYCATHFLEMDDDFEQGNLMSKTEDFLTFIIFSSWKDTFRILKCCEYVSSWAQKLGIVKQCSESIAWKACLDTQGISPTGYDDPLHLKSNKKDQEIVENWWFEDVSVLRIDHFVEVVNGIKAKKMKSRLVGGCITYWTSKWLSKFRLGASFDHKEVQRLTIETLIRLLPTDRNSVSCNLLLHLIELGLILNIEPQLITELERRLAMNLENCSVGDLVVKNYRNDHGTVYDVGLVTRVVEAYVHYLPMIQTPRMVLVANVVDEYLQLVARDDNLTVKSFQLLAEALPENARSCNDKLYRAIDMYLKAHPTLTEEERKILCRTMEYHKLSQEARNHATKNNRLPDDILVRFILMEQINMRVSLLSNGSNFQRSQSQAVVSVTKGPGNKWVRPNKELQVLKGEVEKMKVQLNNLQVCQVHLQRQVKIGLR